MILDRCSSDRSARGGLPRKVAALTPEWRKDLAECSIDLQHCRSVRPLRVVKVSVMIGVCSSKSAHRKKEREAVDRRAARSLLG
jgi:hypothetical protein